MSKSNVISFDCSRRKSRVILIPLLISWFIIGYRNSSSEYVQLNELPMNRTELDVIKSFNLEFHETELVFKLDYNVVFEVTRRNLLKNLRFNFSSRDIIYDVKFLDCELDRNDTNHLYGRYYYQYTGEFTIETLFLYTQIAETKNINITKLNIEQNGSTGSCIKTKNNKLFCNFHKVCNYRDDIVLLSKHSISFPTPILKFDLTSFYFTNLNENFENFSQNNATLIKEKSVLYSIHMRDNNSYNTLQHALAPAISGNIFYNLTDRRTIVVSDAFPNNVGLESELNIEYKSKNNYLCFNDVIFFDTTDIFANLSLSFQHYSLQTPKSILISESLNENLFNMAKTILEFSKPNISVKLINDTTSSCYKELANAEIYVSFHHNNSYLFPAMTNGLFILLIMPGVYPPYELYIDYVKKTNISFVEYYLESPEYINPSLMLEAINLSAHFYNSSDGSRCNYRYLRVFENTQKIANAC